MRITLVGGTYNDDGGRSSGYFARLIREIGNYLDLIGDTETTLDCHNGGTFTELQQINTNGTDVLFWFPDIPNDKVKLVGSLKERNPRMMLVISKNNRDFKYDRLQLIARALQAKANLMVEFNSVSDKIAATVFDPLGNVFVHPTTEVSEVACALISRLRELAAFTRVPSKQVGPENPYTQEQEFFELVRGYAEKFHTLIHAANQNRLLGNVSFRCENGFPSYRDSELIYVSRRNIDKRDINSTGFVAVNATSTDVVEYYGENKPSVDTPIQVRLYDYYPNVKYMLHAHVYIQGAPFTHSIVPCGAIEEFDEIVELMPSRQSSNFCINLKGHGSLVLASSIEYMRDIPYIGRL